MKSNLVPSILARDLLIVGSLASDGEVQIDGRIEGEVSAVAATIGQGAFVKGEIVADTVVVHGRIEGLVNARSVVLVAPAVVKGEIIYDTLAIQSGAILDGSSRRASQAGAHNKPGQVSGSPAETTRAEAEMSLLRPVLLGSPRRPNAAPGKSA
jgi:cytoskeletal protein CcmA (bactofilin family)